MPNAFKWKIYNVYFFLLLYLHQYLSFLHFEGEGHHEFHVWVTGSGGGYICTYYVFYVIYSIYNHFSCMSCVLQFIVLFYYYYVILIFDFVLIFLFSGLEPNKHLELELEP